MQIKIIIATIIFYVPYTALHGYIAKQLEAMQYITGKTITGIKAKGKWHIAGLFVRIILHSIIFFMDVKAGIYSLIIGFLFYDSLVDLWRGKFKFKFVGTCEGLWDLPDCFYITLQKIHINHLIFKIIVSIVVIIYF